MKIEARDPRSIYRVQATRPELEGKLGTSFSLSNGMIGLRGTYAECPEWGRPECYLAGTYTDGPAALLGFHDPDHILAHPDRIQPDARKSLPEHAIQTLPNLPFPLALRTTVANAGFAFDTHKVLSAERRLEIDEATLHRTLVFRDTEGRRTRLDSMRFVSMADPQLVCARTVARRLNHDAPVTLSGYLHEAVTNTNGIKLWHAGQRLAEDGLTGLECCTANADLPISIVQCTRTAETEAGPIIEIFAIIGRMPLEQARQRALAVRDQGFDAARAAHIRAYQQEVASAALDCDAHAALMQGFRFGQMHLHMAFSPIAEQTGIPIKGLTGHGYRFLNFWDMDFHMFPYYLMTKPRRTRKLLEYRYSQLPRYRENARLWGAKGAQVPWETHTRGTEETAPWLCLQDREIHISADATYMFMRYAEVTGDQDVLREMGAEFAFETARFYASRLQWNQQDSRYELPDIGCPDQYHTFADNNLFISLMAQWNLQWAADLFDQPQYQSIAQRIDVYPEEAKAWRQMAQTLFLHEPDAEGIIEQCDGFHALDTDLDGICETYCRHAQAVKQPDVLAAFIPFEQRYPRNIRRANWHFYNARTLHGSSLSLPGMAYAAARCGLHEEALYNLHQSCRMDLDDVNLDTERGVHVSGGAVQWCAIVHGFGGLDAGVDGLAFQPDLPRQWHFLSFTVHWHFQPVHIYICPSAGTVQIRIGEAESCAVPIRVGEQPWQLLNPGTEQTLSYRTPVASDTSG